MKKNEFFEQAKKDLNMSDRQYHEVMNRIFGSISEALINGKNVKIRGFGTFKLTEYKARNGRNPKTGQNIRIPAKRVIKLNVAKELKTEVQKFES